MEVYQQDLDLPASLFDGNSAKKTARWEAGQCLNMKRLTLKIEFEITGSSNVRLLPGWFWFSRISFRDLLLGLGDRFTER